MFTSRYIDPTTDFGFKRLFGQEASKEILRGFLNATLDLRSPIVDLSFIPGEQLGRAPEERSGIYDVYCTDTENRRFIVEMQRGRQVFFRERSLYYITFPIVEQIKRGDTSPPFQLLPIYAISILNFTIDNEPAHRRTIQLCDIATGKPFYEKLTLVYIELPKFQATLSADLPLADKWVYLLRRLPALDAIPSELAQPPFPQAFALAEEAALSPEERERYERILKDELDEQGRIYSARQEGLQTGRQEGLQAGRQEGLQAGRQEGLQAGRQEGLQAGRQEGLQTGRTEGISEATANIARALLAQGVDLATIQAATGLSAAEVQALIQDDS